MFCLCQFLQQGLCSILLLTRIISSCQATAYDSAQSRSPAFSEDLRPRAAHLERIGIDAPFIFSRPGNSTRTANNSYGDDLLNTLLQAMMPVNSTSQPSVARSPALLPPDVLMNNLLTALLPVLSSASENDIRTAAAGVDKLLKGRGIKTQPFN